MLLFLPKLLLPWQETWIFTGQAKVQKVRSTLITLTEKKNVNSAGKGTHFYPFLPSLLTFYPISGRKCTGQSVRNGHPSAYASADAINISLNDRSKRLSINRVFCALY